MTSAASLGVPVALVTILYWPAFGARPFESDNLQILSWADTTRAARLFGANPIVYPEWRPLPYATVWLQYQWAGIDQLWPHFAVNVLLWAACGWLIVRIVHDLSESLGAGLFAAALVLTSTQLISSVVLIEERQSTLACFFGLMAWLVVIRTERAPRSPFTWSVLSLLLLASALSKEYGLAFAAAVAVYAMWERLPARAVAAIAAVAVYGSLRIAFAGGALAPYCEEHGYFFTTRAVCFDRIDAATTTQVAYNIVATGVGTLLPGLFFDDGTIGISPRWLLISAALLPVAVLGWRRGPSPIRVGMLIVVFNTAVSVLLYRPRNHATAICALRRAAPSPALPVFIVVALLGIVSTRAVVMRQLMFDRVEILSGPDASDPGRPDIDRAFMARVWRKYNLQLPECDAGDPR